MAEIPPFKFGRNIDLLSKAGSLGFQIAAPPDADLISSLAANSPFPERTIKATQLRLEADTPQEIIFSCGGSDKIAFTSRASSYAGFGVYLKAADLLADLPAERFLLPALDFRTEDDSLLSVIRWGYDVRAQLEGSMALGAVGKAALNIAGSKEGMFAVIRRLPKTTGARTVVQTTADSWKMPRQIRSIDDMEPGTWILAEVVGSIGVKLGCQLGYDFNWVREVGLGALSGDIGLRLQLGISTLTGFKAAGKCLVVLSREQEAAIIRLRILRLTSKEFDACFDANVEVKPVDRVLPENADDLVRAIFGVHAGQILRDLAVIQKWSDPRQPLADLLADAGAGGAERLVAYMAGISVADLATQFNRVQATAVAFISKWQQLPHGVSTTLMKLIEERVDIDPVRAVAGQLANIDQHGIEKLLADRLGSIGYFTSPVGRYLEAIAGGKVLDLLSKPAEEIRQIGKATSGLLDGSAIENSLRKTQAFIEAELDLNRFLDPIYKTDFDTLDALLKRRLAEFLGKTSLDFADLDKIRTAVGALVRRRQDFYEKAIEALHRKYALEFVSTYQKSTEDQALLDASFDFSLDSARVGEFLQRALCGDFDFVFTNYHPQVRLGLAALSHGIRRQSHMDVTLPFLQASLEELNSSLATAGIEQQEGRVIAYALNSSDTIANNQRTSILSLSIRLGERGTGGNQIRTYQEGLALAYSMVYARRNMQRQHLSARLQPIAAAYFPTKILSVHDYIDFVERRAEEGMPDTPDTLGNGLLSLEVNLPPAVAALAGAAWLSLPRNPRDDKYRRMSCALQAKLKALIPGIYFIEPERYHDLIPAKSLLVYASMPPRVLEDNPPYWDTESKRERDLVLGLSVTVEALRALLKKAQVDLSQSGDRGFYRPEDAEEIIAEVGADDARLRALLFVESEIVRHAFRAGVELADFVESASAKPSTAIQALSNFGAILASAFNRDFVDLYVGDGVRALGTELFLAATRAIVTPPQDPKILDQTNAMLSLEFMKPGLPFDTKALLKKGRLPRDQVAASFHIVELAQAATGCPLSVVSPYRLGYD